MFSAYFPAMPYVSPAWPTRDGVIPYRLFALCMAELPLVRDLRRLDASLAAAEVALASAPAPQPSGSGAA